MGSQVPIIHSHPAGAFCWVELGTTDAAAAREFYTGLFGWEVEEVPLGPSETYTMFKTQGHEHAAMYALRPEHAGVPAHWATYVAAADADASAAKVRALGGAVLAGPFDVRASGRMAICKDPQGATFALWQARRHIGARIANVPGTLCWPELITTDAKAAIAFYTGLFPWTVKQVGSGLADRQADYVEWQLAHRSIGGLLEMQGAPPHWMPYFLVADCAESVQLARDLGAKVQFGATPIAGVGDFALLRDPQGARFTVLSMTAAA